jgi:cell division septal protein FtsQ
MEKEQFNIDFEAPIPKHGRRVYVYFALLTGVILSLFAVKMQWQKHVFVTGVVVEGTKILSQEEIVRMMNLPPRPSMYDLDLTAIQRNILANALIKNAVVQRDAPSQLRIVIEERIPAALLGGIEPFYIDNEGIVLPYLVSSETYDIPVISGVDSLSQIKAGRKIVNSDVREALDIIAAARAVSEEMFHSISEIRVRKGHDIVCYWFDSGMPVIFGKGNVAEKIVKLDSFRKKFLKDKETQAIQYIDIRYDDQVVVSRKS